MHMAALKGLDLAAADAQFGAITHAINLHSDINQGIATFSGGCAAVWCSPKPCSARPS